MSEIPNRFNSNGDDNMNHRGFVRNCNMLQSMFRTSSQSNNGNLFSSSPSFTRYQNSHVSSTSFGLNNSNMFYHAKRNTDSVFGAECFPINDNPQFSRVSVTQTITNRFSAIVPTNTIFNVQTDNGRVNNRPIDCNGIRRVSNPVIDFNNRQILTPSSPNVVDPHQTPHQTYAYPHPQSFRNEQREILTPKPLNVVYPHQASPYRHHVDMFSSTNNNHVPQVAPRVKKTRKPTRVREEARVVTGDQMDSDEDGRNGDDKYDGRTHSLPYEKYGPYTCPKCQGVFDTSQKFAAHMSTHYKSESPNERKKRFRARNKNKYRKLSEEGQEKKAEDGVRSRGVDGEGFPNPVMVKEEDLAMDLA